MLKDVYEIHTVEREMTGVEDEGDSILLRNLIYGVINLEGHAAQSSLLCHTKPMKAVASLVRVDGRL